MPDDGRRGAAVDRRADPRKVFRQDQRQRQNRRDIGLFRPGGPELRRLVPRRGMDPIPSGSQRPRTAREHGEQQFPNGFQTTATAVAEKIIVQTQQHFGHRKPGVFRFAGSRRTRLELQFAKQ